MNRCLLVSIFFLFAVAANAQQTICVPDSTLADSVFISPPPLSENNPEGGIPDSACVGQPFSTALTLKVPNSVTASGFMVTLDSIAITSTGAIGGLPNGMSYNCNPSGCVYYPDTIASGCLILYGIPNDTTGTYDLTITATLFTRELGPLTIELPSDAVMGAEGSYALTVLPEGSSNCFVDTLSATVDLLATQVRIENVPNPFSDYTAIRIQSSINDQLDFKVYDLLGREVHYERIQIFEGANNFRFEGANLNNGIYVYTLANADGLVSKKMVLNK